MGNTRVWEGACGLTRTVVEAVGFDELAVAIVVAVRRNAKAGPVRAVQSTLAWL